MELDNVDLLGFLAASLVLTTFCMRSMSKLRLMAMTSNVAFVSYGIAGDLLPVMLLHGLLLPINAYWFFQPKTAGS